MVGHNELGNVLAGHYTEVVVGGHMLSTWVWRRCILSDCSIPNTMGRRRITDFEGHMLMTRINMRSTLFGVHAPVS